MYWIIENKKEKKPTLITVILVALWFFAFTRERLSGAGVSMFIVPLVLGKIQWLRVDEY